MTHSTNADGELGLFFADELEENVAQAFGYWLPIPASRMSRYRFEFFDFELFDLEVKFPCSFRGEYVELTSRVTSPELVFRIDSLSREVVFELDLAPLGLTSFRKRGLKPRNLYSYVGGVKSLATAEAVFVELSPVDIDEMNESYLEDGFVFVGQTTRFGRETESIFRYR